MKLKLKILIYGLVLGIILFVSLKLIIGDVVDYFETIPVDKASKEHLDSMPLSGAERAVQVLKIEDRSTSLCLIGATAFIGFTFVTLVIKQGQKLPFFTKLSVLFALILFAFSIWYWRLLEMLRIELILKGISVRYWIEYRYWVYRDFQQALLIAGVFFLTPAILPYFFQK